MSKLNPFEYVSLMPNGDGTYTRLLNFPPAKLNDDPSTGEPVLSRDVIINSERGTKLRLYLPIKCTSRNKRLPIVFYFHGCTWVQFSGDNPAIHLERQWTAGTIPAFVILVHYGLSPENRLPFQYDEGEDSILWIKKQIEDPNGDQWIKNYGDVSKCFISGSGNGANIGFFSVLRVIGMDLYPLKILGVIMNQPLFGGEQRTDSEIRFAADQIIPLTALDFVWELTLPKGANRDHPYCNPMLDGPHKEKIKRLPACLVLGFGMDPLIDRQQEFVQMLMHNGVKVDAHFEEFGFHRIEIVDPKKRVMLLNIVKQFIHSQIAYTTAHNDHLRPGEAGDHTANRITE